MSISPRKFHCILATFTLYFFIITMLPIQGFQPKALAFSVGEEREVGEKLLSVIRQNFEVLDDPDIAEYINGLGEHILTVAGHQFFNYHFFVIKNSEFNAFAAPSGLIFVHSGLLEAMSNEGELVSVLAHECAHVTSRHISDRIQKTQKTSMLSAAMLIAGIAIGAGPLTEALITGSMAGNAAMSLQFSRQDEEEADRLAYKWMNSMKMDPAPMASMLNKMHRESVYHTANIPPYLLSHPEPKRRMGYVQELIGSNPATTYPPRDDFDFLRIRYRVLSKTKSAATLRAMASRQSAKDTAIGIKMADYGLFLAQLETADYQAAEQSILKVIAAFPEKTVLQTDLAVLFIKSNQLDRAFPLLTAAIKRSPDNAYTQYNLAQIYQKRGEANKALLLYEKLLSKFPDHGRMHYDIGSLKSQLGQTASAHYHLGYYFWLEGDKKNTQYHLNLAKNQTEDLPSQALATQLLAKIERLEKV